MFTSEIDPTERTYIETPTITAGPAKKMHTLKIDRSLQRCCLTALSLSIDFC